MALSVDIADAVATKINAGKPATFSQTFTAVRSFIPRDRFEEIDGYKVYVTPGELVATPFDRKNVKATYEIDVAVAIKADSDTDVENALSFTEQIQDYLADEDNHEVIADKVLWLPPYVNSPIFDRKKLDEMQLFLSVTSFKYEVLR